jgi:hypothetical protein
LPFAVPHTDCAVLRQAMMIDWQQTLLGLQAEAFPVYAAQASCACDWLWLPEPLQSKKFWPTPLLCVVWQPVPQQPGLAHSQPSVSGALPELQSVRPLLQAYEHFVPLQLGWPVLLLQVTPQSPQFEVEFSGVSQPFVSGAVVVQSLKPAAQPVYLQVAVPLVLHEAPLLWDVSQATPQLPQFCAVLTWVSQPFVFGGVVLQSL